MVERERWRYQREMEMGRGKEVEDDQRGLEVAENVRFDVSAFVNFFSR